MRAELGDSVIYKNKKCVIVAEYANTPIKYDLLDESGKRYEQVARAEVIIP